MIYLIKIEEERSMYCNKCGASVAEGTKFCPSCGNDLTVVQNNQVG